MKNVRGLVFLALALCGGSAWSHEVRPAYLEITEREHTIDVVWRQPVQGEYAIALSPHLSADWLEQPPTRQSVTPHTLTRIWQVPAPTVPLSHQTLTVSGLERTLTDVFVHVQWRSGEVSTALLKPLQATMVLSPQQGGGAAIREYFQLGVVHIWSGYDHLLYLTGLMLLVRGWRALVGVVTAFTLAHSLTLALSALDLVRLPPAPVEAVIALSILFVAVELARGQRGARHLVHRHPWIVAFSFGLLHGFGFAGALRGIGLPEDARMPALLLFNLGIEAGQLAFVALAVGLLWALARRLPRVHEPALRVLPGVIGALASWWLIERIAGMGSGT